MRREIKRQRKRIREKCKSVTVVIFGGPNFWINNGGKFFRVLLLTDSVFDHLQQTFVIIFARM